MEQGGGCRFNKGSYFHFRCSYRKNWSRQPNLPCFISWVYQSHNT